MSTTGPGTRAALARGAGLLGFWVVLIGGDPVDVAAGMLAAAAATWASLRLLPPQAERLRLLALPRLILRFVRQSGVAGVDVARRALDPRLPLRPGFTTVPVGIPPGLVRSAFVAITCLLPGTVAVGEDTGRILYHCLDTDQPVATQVADEEAALRRVLGGSPP